MRSLAVLLAALLVLFTTPVLADDHDDDTNDPRLTAKTFSKIELRSIGPALMSGRIADIALHPEDPSVWYVGVGSGGVWKTVNAGTTWTPLFDDQASYSIGCVTIDPSHPEIVWVGTGENVGGRHVGYGDGIYRSQDGGKTWENLGLRRSEHISKIVVHPDDSDVVWVAAQGPLWTKGGERGVFKTTDGGKTWEQVLQVGPWTGATDLVIDPRDPDVLYAAMWQRHRTVATYVSGGPNTGIHRSLDGGETWEKLTNGLPKGNMGKIGLAISPMKPDVLYAAIELDRREGGVWRSDDRGGSWVEGADAVAGGTGPHYYQELYACPHNFDRIYLADVRIQISDDGGKTFRRLPGEAKHVDHHALVFREDDPDYLLIGTDGGLYESFDAADNWRFIDNLPITQFYKLAVDDAEPFYHVYGGTQDNNTQGGPVRTDNVHGIRNADWFVTRGGDGHQPATEPGNPDIVYAQAQQGYIVRHDRTTGENVDIRPQPAPGDPPERFNWDAPILVSPHDPKRIYFGSQRVWRSDDRGDTWRTISGDLTRDQDRMLLEVMDRQQSWDSPWDMIAMSKYNTITSLAESPLVDGLFYVGTDDGLLAVTENGGEEWRQIEVGSLPDVPDTAFVNDVKADLHDADTVYVALDDHKFGDFSPYLLKSTDRGRSWTSIAGDLPERHLVWRVVQDHVDPDLLFAGTEFGVFFTVDGGKEWIELTGGVPTIPFRDLAIQRRENDLVGATFGRSFYVLDDYSFLREVDEEALAAEARLFPTRDAWWYVERRTLGRSKRGSQGASYYVAENPPFGAVFTYHLAESLMTREKRRQKTEKPKIEAGEDTPRPPWDELEAERREAEPKVLLVVRDADGQVVRRVEGPATKGFHRVAWDLRFPSARAITRAPSEDRRGREPEGFLVAPGRYTVTLAKSVDGAATEIGEPVSFRVKRMRTGALDGAEPEETVAFWKRLAEAERRLSATNAELSKAMDRVKVFAAALARTPAAPGTLDAELERIRQALFAIDEELHGNRSKRSVGEVYEATVQNRLRHAISGTRNSTYGPTPTHRRAVEIVESELGSIRQRLVELTETALPALERRLEEAGAPLTP